MTVEVQAELFAATLEKKLELLKNAKGGFFSSSFDFGALTKFLIESLDEAIKYAQETMVDGKEKKAFVLAVLSRLYDTTIAPTLPYWAYPFASTIKSIVINTIISKAIDWIVEKYKNGSWNKDITPAPVPDVPSV